MYFKPSQNAGFKITGSKNMSKRKSTEVQGFQISYHNIEATRKENFLNTADLLCLKKNV